MSQSEEEHVGSIIVDELQKLTSMNELPKQLNDTGYTVCLSVLPRWLGKTRREDLAERISDAMTSAHVEWLAAEHAQMRREFQDSLTVREEESRQRHQEELAQARKHVLASAMHAINTMPRNGGRKMALDALLEYAFVADIELDEEIS